MRSRYIAILALALSLGGLVAEHRVGPALKFREYYNNLNHDDPELNAWQRVLVTLMLTNSE